ncbi:MAG: hypothetical protein ACYS99_20970, partial [Planctomycetota bacterium]
MLLLALLVSEGGFVVYGSRVRSHRDEFLGDELERGLERVREIFRGREQRATALAERVSGEIAKKGLLREPEGFLRIDLFRLLDEVRLPPEISGIAVRDATGTPVAWRAKTFDLPPEPPSRPTSGIFQSRVYRVLYSEVPVGATGSTVGSVAVFSPFDLRYFLHNRYLRSGDFEEEVSRRFWLEDIDISSGDHALREAERGERRLAGTIENAAGEKIAHLNVQVFPVETYLARINHRRREVRGILLAGALLVLTALVARAALRPGAGLGPTLAFVALAAVTRVLMFLLGFPGLLFSGTSFDPAQFSLLSNFLGLDLGLFHSPGDLVITGAFLLAAVAVAGVSFSRWVRSVLPEERRPLKGLLLVPGSLFVVGVGALNWSTLLNVLTFYSTVEYFPEQAVLPETPAFLLLLGLFFLSLAFLLVASGALHVAAAFIAGRRAAARTVTLLALLVPVGAVLSTATDMGVWIAALVAAGLVGAAALFTGWTSLGWGIRLAALTGLATVIGFPPFVLEVMKEVRADVEEEAQDLFYPAQEKPLRHLLRSDLEELASNERLISRLSRPARRRPLLAFRLWAEGPLSRRPRGADLTILGRDRKRICPRFEIDMPPESWLPEPLPGFSPDELTVQEVPGKGPGRRQVFLIGSAPVYSESGEFLAQVIVRMPAERPTLGTGPRPEILRSYEDETVSGEVRELHYTEYDGEVLARTTNPDYPRIHRAAPDVVRAILTEERAQHWAREEVAGASWVNLYRPRYEDGQLTGIMCVGFRSKETRSIFLAFFKLLLVNFFDD